ncbi:UDP-3-O-[3-hydroxymyristoyl] glucosamine N-acyltransferase [Phytophthora nicotianae]|uniref:UDP-3-O-[3-hydroxymyristoyl] glucosamine N-acyltransferase n=1 Tax=Phytophthora nicotianae TaxID=4792 RepID=W2H8L6_PHYNI|nr:UDP-3-O-[3-hydroxymyristoyl] glucosamine N-acyltransferase [Phytophthora nicotianae]
MWVLRAPVAGRCARGSMVSHAMHCGGNAGNLLPKRASEFGRAFSESSSSGSDTFPTTVIHPSAKIGKGCRIGEFSTIGEDVVIEDGTTIGANVTLQNCTIGSRVVIHPGARIGQDGFGFMLDAKGEHTKKPQELRVEIHDHVEIGANCTIDRGSWRNTVVGNGCKLDNLIQIGHNVQLGTGCVIAAQTGIAGSTTLGNNVYIGGQVGVAQHLKIGDNVRIAAKSGVMNNLESNATYGGSPAVPIMEYRRQMAHLRRLGKEIAD